MIILIIINILFSISDERWSSHWFSDAFTFVGNLSA